MTVLLCGQFDHDEIGGHAQLSALAASLCDVELEAIAPRDVCDRLGIDGVPFTPLALERAVRRCDVVVVAGGEALDPRAVGAPWSPLATTATLAHLAKLLHRRVAVVGAGSSIGRTARSRALARSAIRSADLVVLRDEPSALALQQMGAPSPFRVAGDPAWTILGAGRPPAPMAERSGVTIALDGAAPIDDLLPLLAGLIQHVARHRDVRLQPWHDRDLGLAHQLTDRVGPAVIVSKPASLFEAASQFAYDELVVSMRLHATIAAASAGVHSLSIGHHASIVDMASRLGQPVLPTGATPDELDRLVATSFGTPPSADTIRAENDSAAKSMTLLRMLIELGDIDDLADVDGLQLLPMGAID